MRELKIYQQESCRAIKNRSISCGEMKHSDCHRSEIAHHKAAGRPQRLKYSFFGDGSNPTDIRLREQSTSRSKTTAQTEKKRRELPIKLHEPVYPLLNFYSPVITDSKKRIVSCWSNGTFVELPSQLPFFNHGQSEQTTRPVIRRAHNHPATANGLGTEALEVAKTGQITKTESLAQA